MGGWETFPCVHQKYVLVGYGFDGNFEKSMALRGSGAGSTIKLFLPLETPSTPLLPDLGEEATTTADIALQ